MSNATKFAARVGQQAVDIMSRKIKGVEVDFEVASASLRSNQESHVEINYFMGSKGAAMKTTFRPAGNVRLEALVDAGKKLADAHASNILSWAEANGIT